MPKVHSHANDRLVHRYYHKLLLKLPKIDLRQPQQRWWIATTAFALCVIGFFISPWMRLSVVHCHTDTNDACPDFIVPEINKYTGQLMFRLPLTSIADSIHAVAPNLGDIRFIRQWPSTLIVELSTQIPIANMQTETSGNALLLSQNRYVLASQTQPNNMLPIIIASQAANLTIGDHLTDQSLVAAVDLAQTLPSMIGNRSFQITVLSPLNIRVTSPDNKRFIFAANKPINDQLHALQLILATTTINTSSHIVDLRYDKPVIKLTW